VRLRLILVARRRHHDRVGLLAYPCEDCRNTVPIYYCDACRGQYENDTTDQKLIVHFAVSCKVARWRLTLNDCGDFNLDQKTWI
jgi:hypothetical protein